MENPHLYPHPPEEPIEAFPPYCSSDACPRCHSHQIEVRNYATKIGCVIGAIAGMGVSLASHARGARLGLSIGGPIGATIGGIAGAVLDKDYPVIQGGVMFLAIVFVLVNLVVDVLYAFIDPRIRVS